MRIRTKLDDIIDYLRKNKEASIDELRNKFDISDKECHVYCRLLDESKVIKISYPPIGHPIVSYLGTKEEKDSVEKNTDFIAQKKHSVKKEEKPKSCPTNTTVKKEIPKPKEKKGLFSFLSSKKQTPSFVKPIAKKKISKSKAIPKKKKSSITKKKSVSSKKPAKKGKSVFSFLKPKKKGGKNAKKK